MRKLTTISTMVTLSLVMSGCFESGSEAPAPAAIPPPPTGVVTDGKTYYTNNCGTCHKAGADDTTSAFGASELAQKHDMIKSNMSDYDATSTFNLMSSFTNVPEQRVADLKAYLRSIQPSP